MIVRPPRESEWSACRMLLPGAFERPGRPEFRLAVEEEPPRILGAASFLRGGATRSVRIHVPAPLRRRSIGSALLACLIDDARREGDREIAADVAVEREPETRAFLEARGFTCRQRLLSAEVDFDVARPILRSLTGRLSGCGKLPGRARIVPFDPEHTDAVLRLYRDYIIENPDVHTPLLRTPGDLRRFRHSQVLLVEGKVEGVLLFERDGAVATITAFVLTARYRRGGAAALLLASGLDSALREGARRTRFQYLEDNRNMAMLARHFNAKPLGALARFVYEISP